jgi:DNA polymerase III epsilon subunit-like protein
MFVSYLELYHIRSNSKKSCFSAPIAAGYNINRYDLRIVDRLSQKYGNLNKEGRSSLFYPRDVVDLMNMVFYWFENNNDLKNYTLDSVRDYFSISKEGAHDALKDVEDTAQILIRFLKLHRRMSKQIKFKGSFSNA